MLVVEGASLGLEVGSVGPSDFGTFVPREAEPPQPVQDRRQRLARGARGVGVLDAQHEDATLSTREEVIVEGGADASDVEVPGGARGEANANAHGAAKILCRGRRLKG